MPMLAIAANNLIIFILDNQLILQYDFMQF